MAWIISAALGQRQPSSATLRTQPPAYHDPHFFNPPVHTMPRPILDEAHIHPAIRQRIANHEQTIVQEVQAAVRSQRVVVVGMAQNPVVKSLRRLLQNTGVTFTYLEYGSYFSQWRTRTALKLWTGWPTFPMVFRDGVLLGGYEDVKALIAAGELRGDAKA